MNGDDMSQPVTRGELKAEVEKLQLEIQFWGGALKAKIDSKFDTLRGELYELRGEFNELRGEFNELRGEFNELRGDIGRHANAIVEALRVEMRTLLEPFDDLPARVTRLEEAAFTPKPKRRRRRAA